MKIGICGLGLIGGSLAKSYAEARRQDGDFTVYGYDRDEATQAAALDGVLDGTLDDSVLPECDLLLIALHPDAAEAYMSHVAPLVKKEAIVIDLCGTKSKICAIGFALAEQYGYTYVGGHPMAGTQYSGFDHARANLFHGAPMVIVPPEVYDDELLPHLRGLLSPAGFGRFSVTTADYHDRQIAFTSQLAHVVSNAYVKSPTAKSHKGFSAGSYKDLTRVAWLNENMWTELFLENRDPLLFEIDTIIASLGEYRDAIAENDAERLRSLLRDGRIAKEQVDGK